MPDTTRDTTEVHPRSTAATPQGDRPEGDGDAYKALHVRLETHREIKAEAARLDRTVDSIVWAGLLMVRERTKAEGRRATDRQWAEQIASS